MLAFSIYNVDKIVKKRKYSILKHLLTTASIVSISLNAASVGANNFTANVNLDTTATPGVWARGPAPSILVALTPPSNNDTLYFGADIKIYFLGGVLNSALPGQGTNFGINVGNSSGKVFIGDNAAYTISSIAPAASANSLTIGFNAAGALTVNDTSGLVSKISFGNKNGTITINNGNIPGPVDGFFAKAGPSVGTLNINGITTITGLVGAVTPISTINVGRALTLTKNTNSSNTNLVNENSGVILSANTILAGNVNFSSKSSQFIMNNGALITGNVDSAVNPIGLAVAAVPSVGLINAATCQINGDFGITNPLLIIFQGDSILKIQGSTVNINGTTNDDVRGTLYLSNAVNTNFSGTIGLAADDAGHIHRINSVYWADAGTPRTLTLEESEIYVDNLNGFNAGSRLVIDGPVTMYTTTVTNAVTTINNGGTLTLEGVTTFQSTIDGSGLNEGTLDIGSTGTVTLNGIVGGTFPLAEINITGGNLTVNANVSAETLQFSVANGTFALGSNTFTGNIIFDDPNDTITTTVGAIIDGGIDVIGGAVNAGTLAIGGDTTVTGSVGATNAINVTFANNEVLTIDGAVVNINGTTNNANNGNITLGGASTVTGTIGGAGAISTLTATAGDTTLGAATAITAHTINATGHNIIVNGNGVALTTTNGITAATIKFAGANTATLTGNLTGGVDFNGQAATLTIDGGNISTTVDNLGGGVGGTLVISGATTITGAIGNTNALTAINIGVGGVLTSGGAIAATTTTLGAGSTLTLGGNVAGAVTANGAGSIINLGANTITGTVNFGANAGTLNIAGGTVGANVQGGTIVLTGNSTVTGTFGANNAVNATLGAHTLTINGASANFAGVSGTGASAITLGAATNLDGLIGTNGNAIGTVTLGAATTLGQHAVTTIYADTVTGAVGNRNLTTNAANATTINASTALTVGTGTLTFNGATTINSPAVTANSMTVNAATTFTSAAANVGAVTINGGNTLTVDGTTTFNGDISGGAADQGAIFISAGNLIINNKIGNGGTNSLNLISIETGATITTAVGATVDTSNFKFVGNGSATLNANLTGNIDFGGTNGTVTAASPLTITGNIDGNLSDIMGVSAGTLILTANTTVTGVIGNTSPLHLIEIHSGVFTANSNISVSMLQFTGVGTATLQGTAFNGDIDFNGIASTVNISSDNTTITGLIDGNITAGAGNFGNLYIQGLNATIMKGVGADTPLSILQIQNGGSLTVQNVLSAATINLIGNANLVANDVVQSNNITINTGTFTTNNIVTGIGGGASSLTFNNAGEVVLSGGLNGNVNFNGNNGVLTLNYGNIANISTNTVPSGTFNIFGVSNSGSIGAGGTAIDALNVKNAAMLSASTINAQSINLLGTGILITSGSIQTNLIVINYGTLNAGGIINSDTITIDNGVLISNANINGSAGGGANSTVTIGDGTLELLGVSSLKGSVIFNGSGEVMLSAGGISGSVTTTTDGDGVILLDSGVVTGNIGQSNFRLGEVVLDGTAITVTNTNSIYANTIAVTAGSVNLSANGSLGSITSTTKIVLDTESELNINSSNIFGTISGDGTGVTIFNLDPSATNIASSTGLGSITFGVGGTINKQYLARNYLINGDATISSGAQFAPNSTMSIFTGNSLIVNDSSVFDVKQINGLGSVKFNIYGNLPQIGSSTAYVSTVYLNSTNIYTISNDIYANNVIVESGTTYQATADHTIYGQLQFIDNATLDLQSANLTVNGGVVTGNTITVNSILSASGTSGNLQSSVQIAGNVLNLTLDTSALAINNKVYQIFSSVDGEPSSYNIITVPPSSFNFEYSGGKIQAKGLPTISSDIIELLDSEAIDNPNEELFEDILKNPETATEELFRIEKTASQTVHSKNYNFSWNIVSAVSTHLSRAINHHIGSQFSVPAISSGDEDLRKSAWLQGFGNLTEQGKRTVDPAYRSTTTGIIAGYDFEIKEDLIIGGAVAYAGTKVRMKNQKQGDRIKANTWIFSLYSMYEFNDHWFVNGTVAFGNVNVVNKERKLSGGRYSVSSGKQTTQTNTIDVAIGYKYNFKDKFTVAPVIGINTNFFNDTSYIETGAAKFNRTVTKGSGSSYIAYFGAAVTTEANFNDSVVTSNMHAKITQEINAKNPVITSQIFQQTGTYTSKISNVNKTIYYTGFDLKISNKIVDVTTGYDLGFCKNYISHTGALKLRINF